MNLTQLSAFVKKAFKFTVIFIASYYLIVYVIFPGSKSLIKSLINKKNPANLTYGIMDKLAFVEKPIGATKPQYVLNTKNGKLPSGMPYQMKVYQFKPIQYSYLASKNALAEASTLGFTDKDLVSDLKGNEYIWRNSSIQSVLTIELNTRRLFLNTDMNGKSLLFPSGSLESSKAVTYAQNVLESIGRFDEMYKNGTQTTKMGSYQGGKLYETNDPDEAQVFMVNLFRKIEDYPIVGPDPEKGLLRIYVKKPEEIKNPLNTPVVEASYWEINPTSKSAYPIISVNEAWSAVKNGRGVISNVTPKGSNPFGNYIPADIERILVDNIFLAYYETPKYQNYLQPIYVFSGTYTKIGVPGGYVTVYYPAISGQYVKQETQASQSSPGK